MDQRLVVWSAHEFRTSQEAFRDMEELIMGTPDFARRVKAIHRGNGDEAIELFGDRRLMFKARTKSGGRGLSGDKIILDEGFALQPSHMGSLFPTLAARPDPQVVYGSSAGKVESGCCGACGTAAGRRTSALAYLEWCAPPPKEACADGEACTHALDAEGLRLRQPGAGQGGQPGVGRRITVDYIRGERRALPPAEFARERMGWWDDPIGGETPIKPDDWTACLDEESRRTGSVALAVDITPDRSVSSIAISGRRADGLVHGEVIEHRAGTGWVVDRLVELFEKTIKPTPVALVIDPAGPAGSLEKKLLERGFTLDKELMPGQWRLHFMGSREYAQACGALADDIANGEFRHIGQAPLDTAVEGVATRPLAEAWAWSRGKSGATIAPLVAVTLARHGHATFGVTEPVAPFALFGSRR
jgi:hypothetical protein